jgi:hypothetical protein
MGNMANEKRHAIMAIMERTFIDEN